VSTRKRDVKDGKITVEIKGVDVYDPTTGAIRSSSTES
jgi:adenine-specific DNA-methyltransferase